MNMVYLRKRIYVCSSRSLHESRADLLLVGCIYCKETRITAKAPIHFWNRAFVRLFGNSPDVAIWPVHRHNTSLAHHNWHCFSGRNGISFYAGVRCGDGSPGRSGESSLSSRKSKHLYLLASRLLQRSDRGFSLEIILALKMLGYSVTMPFH